MNVINKLSKYRLLGKLLISILIFLVSIVIILLSCNIDNSYKDIPTCVWFIKLSQIIYTILIIYSVTNIIITILCYIKLHKIFTINKELKNLGKYKLNISSTKCLSHTLIKNTIINPPQPVKEETKSIFSNDNIKPNSIINNDLIFKKGFYEYLPLPLVVTNEDGKIMHCNSLAKEFFQSDLMTKNISNFIEPLNTNIFNSWVIVNAKISKPKGEKLVSSVFQTSVFNEKKLLSYVVLIFLPSTLKNSEDDLSNTQLVNTEKENTLQNINNLFGINNLTPNMLEKFANYLSFGMLILNKENNIISLNNRAIEILSNDLLDINIKFNNKLDIINKNFSDIFNTILKKDQLFYLLNDNGKVQLNVKNSFFLEIHGQEIYENKLITLVDITEKRKLELQNNFSQRLQTVGQIASAVAHDFNNLLTAIMGFTHFLKERYTLEDPATLELKQIEQNANRAKVMIRQLLTFSRGKDLNPVTFAVNSEISNLMSTILRLMGERIKTEFIRGKNIGEITIDPVQFQQVIINLVVNARDAMKKGGNLTISTNRVSLLQPKEAVMLTIPSGEYIVVSIKDEGDGIEKGNLKKIFQTHFSTKGDKGNGLGLATVAKIMQENAGYIYLESIIGKGSIFSLYFTTEHKEQSIDKTENENFSIKKLSTKAKDIAIDLTGEETILLVEDEIPVRSVCKRALVSKGYKVIEAEDAESALTLLQNSSNNVDLIISDVMMPGLSGLEFVYEARKIKPDIKAILMSGYAEDTLEADHYTLDSIEFLAKPFNPDVLTTKVKKVINNLGD